MVTLLLAAMATYRLARMIAAEEGPFGLFTRLRGALDPDQATWLGRGVNCPLCVGFWVALPVAVVVSVLGAADVWAWPITWFGIAGAAALLHKWETKR